MLSTSSLTLLTVRSLVISALSLFSALALALAAPFAEKSMLAFTETL